ncbi:MAG: hypothetical protein U0326_38350 [Polyangiales bacterium]
MSDARDRSHTPPSAGVQRSDEASNEVSPRCVRTERASAKEASVSAARLANATGSAAMTKSGRAETAPRTPTRRAARRRRTPAMTEKASVRAGEATIKRNTNAARVH